MKKILPTLTILLVSSISFINCEQTESEKTSPVNLNKVISKNWEEDLQKATSFEEETALLKKLIQVDTANTYQQLVSNRLQTFDLKHLNEAEKLVIIDLYQLSLLPENTPSLNVLQIAFTKLNGIYPNENKSVNKAISKVLGIIKNQVESELE